MIPMVFEQRFIEQIVTTFQLLPPSDKEREVLLRILRDKETNLSTEAWILYYYWTGLKGESIPIEKFTAFLLARSFKPGTENAHRVAKGKFKWVRWFIDAFKKLAAQSELISLDVINRGERLITEVWEWYYPFLTTNFPPNTNPHLLLTFLGVEKQRSGPSMTPIFSIMEYL